MLRDMDSLAAREEGTEVSRVSMITVLDCIEGKYNKHSFKIVISCCASAENNEDEYEVIEL